MLKQRIIVKFVNFKNKRRLAGNPLSTALIYEDLKLDEMMFCDLQTISPWLIHSVTTGVFTPVTCAGSIHTMEQVDELIGKSGADKVVVRDEPLGCAVAQKYGRQAVVWPIDYFGECVDDVPDCAGEVLLTSIDRDGTGKGLDLMVLKRNWRVPVVLSGGCGKLSHARDAFAEGADGVAISSMFFFSDKSPIKLRSWLASEGTNVRVV
jgi:imidazole glycerol-phosphate synthase subunit HisF